MSARARRLGAGRAPGRSWLGGLSLVEVLLANCFLVALAFLCFQVYVRGSATTSKFDLRLEAMNHARTLIEQLRALPLEPPDFDRLDEDCFEPITTGSLGAGQAMYLPTLTYRVSKLSEETRRLEVTVEWKEDRDDDRRSVSLMTVVARSPYNCFWSPSPSPSPSSSPSPSPSSSPSPSPSPSPSGSPSPPCKLCQYYEVYESVRGIGDGWFLLVPCSVEVPESEPCHAGPPAGRCPEQAANHTGWHLLSDGESLPTRAQYQGHPEEPAWNPPPCR